MNSSFFSNLTGNISFFSILTKTILTKRQEPDGFEPIYPSMDQFWFITMAKYTVIIENWFVIELHASSRTEGQKWED